MSISIALLPVALAMRIVMGKDNFDAWVRSQQVRTQSNFVTELDLFRAVKKANYDAIKFGASIKTHLADGKSFFFWELEGDRWVAVFSKAHDKVLIDKFMSDVETAAGHQIFGTRDFIVEASTERFPTNFNDATTLKQVLSQIGANPEEDADGTISCAIQDSTLVFTRIGDSPFTLEVTNTPGLENAYRYLSEIDEDYKRAVQTAVYQKVKSRASANNMMVESEEVLPDKTIVLTLRIL